MGLQGRLGSSVAHAVLLSNLLVLGCGPLVGDEVAAGTGEASSTDASGPSTSASVPPPVDPPSSTGATAATVSTSGGATTDEASSSDSGAAFLIEPDWHGPTIECSVWEQDCPPGEKCTAWAHDGGEGWNATRCVPVVDDPAQAGEACTVQGAPTSGLDDCDIGHMCWSIDPATNEGRCVPLCTGSVENPICEDPDLVCPIGAEPILNLCLPRCDPLGQDCLDHEGCFEAHAVLVCLPHGQAQYGETCEWINECDAGLHCTGGSNVPDCAGASCCTSYCDITAANTCPGDGQECVPWFDRGRAPEGLDNLGSCLLP